MNSLMIKSVDIADHASNCVEVEFLSPSVNASFDKYSFSVELYIKSDKAVETIRFNALGEIHDEVKPVGCNQENHVHLTHIKCEISTLGLSEAFNVVVVAELENGEYIRLGQIKGARNRLSVAETSAFMPICVNGIPRSGTTFLMGLMSSHPQLVSKDAYPFEHRPAMYWVHLFQALSRPNNAVGGMWNWAFEEDKNKVGAFPYSPGMDETDAWVANGYIDSLARFCIQSVDQTYKLIADQNNKPDAGFFLEKFPGLKGKYISELYPSYHEVVIVRDIRDVFCSVKSFNKQRGRDDFGVDRHDDDKSYLRSLGVLLRKMYNKRTMGCSRTRYHLVKYEDLIVSPVDTVLDLYKRLGMNVGNDVVGNLEAALSSNNLNVSSHRTGAAGNDVARWKVDLPEALNDFVFEEFGDLLNSLGYQKG